jgi:Txe/YoeB family toxin of Txe-Axe toxin-antitoxin module
LLRKILRVGKQTEFGEDCLKKMRRLINKVKNDPTYGKVKYIAKKEKIEKTYKEQFKYH